MTSVKNLLFRKLHPEPNVVVRREENCYLLVNRKNGKVLAINSVGLEIWRLLSEFTIKDIINTIAEKYEVDRTSCKEEVLKFVKKILENDFAFL